MAHAQMREPVLITNNPACKEAFAPVCGCIYCDSWTYGQVLQAAKDKIRCGFRLLSHPLAGSMKPNQTPFRSILLAERSADGPDTAQSLAMLDAALDAYKKFQTLHATPAWTQAVRKDFGTIDLSITRAMMERAGIWAAGRQGT